MKTIKIFMVLAVLAFLATGCGPFFRNQAQYDNGVWWGVARQGEVARMKQDRMAFAKLQAAPAQTQTINGIQQGYEGLVANLSSYSRYNFKITGPETKSFMLGPGERARDYLIPGGYICTVFQGSSRVGSWSFRVGPQQSTFMNERYHWYVYTDR